MSSFRRLLESVFSTDPGIRWTDAASVGRRQRPLDGRSVRWTDAASAGQSVSQMDEVEQWGLSDCH